MENKKIKKLNWYSIINNCLRIFIIISIIIFATQKQYEKSNFLLIAFTLTFYDCFVKKFLKIELNTIEKISLLLLIFTAQCLGSVYDFYARFHWWDTIVHGISGMIFFYIGIEVIKQLNYRLTKNNTHIVIQILFAICFSLSIIVLWELFEFTEDKFFGENMQNTKNLCGQDAIWDTIEDSLAALIGTLVGTIIETLRCKIMYNKKLK